MPKLALALCLAFFTSCVTVNSVTLNQVPAKESRNRLVKSSAIGVGVLFIPFGSSFPDDAHADLISQCPKGKIEGLLTKYETTSYPFFWIDTVSMQGYCINPRSEKELS